MTLVSEGSHILESGDRLAGDTYILNGELIVEPGATLAGSVYMLDGSMTVNGEVSGDISLLGGDLLLGPQARVGGTLNLGGGELVRSPQATIQGGVNTGTGLQLPENTGLFGGSLAGALINTLLRALLVAALAYLLARYLPGPLARVTETIVHHSVVAGAMGVLAGVIALVLLVLIASTILLIPLAIMGGFVLLLAVVYKWAGFGMATGRLLVRWLPWQLRPASAALLGTLIFMLVIDLLRFIPVIAGIIPLLTAAIGFGAVILTRFGLRTFVPAVDLEAPDLVPPQSPNQNE